MDTEAAPPDASEGMLVGRSGTTQALARAVRDLVHECDPLVVEVPWSKQRVLGLGIGPRKSTEHYAFLALHTEHVHVGSNEGAELDDPAGLLSGLGKRLRHHQLHNLDDVRSPPLREMLLRPREHRAGTAHASGSFRDRGDARAAEEAG